MSSEIPHSGYASFEYLLNAFTIENAIFYFVAYVIRIFLIGLFSFCSCVCTCLISMLLLFTRKIMFTIMRGLFKLIRLISNILHWLLYARKRLDLTLSTLSVSLLVWILNVSFDKNFALITSIGIAVAALTTTYVISAITNINHTYIIIMELIMYLLMFSAVAMVFLKLWKIAIRLICSVKIIQEVLYKIRYIYRTGKILPTEGKKMLESPPTYPETNHLEFKNPEMFIRRDVQTQNAGNESQFIKCMELKSEVSRDSFIKARNLLNLETLNFESVDYINKNETNDEIVKMNEINLNENSAVMKKLEMLDSHRKNELVKCIQVETVKTAFAAELSAIEVQCIAKHTREGNCEGNSFEVLVSKAMAKEMHVQQTSNTRFENGKTGTPNIESKGCELDDVESNTEDNQQKSLKEDVSILNTNWKEMTTNEVLTFSKPGENSERHSITNSFDTEEIQKVFEEGTMLGSREANSMLLVDSRISLKPEVHLSNIRFTSNLPTNECKPKKCKTKASLIDAETETQSVKFISNVEDAVNRIDLRFIYALQ